MLDLCIYCATLKRTIPEDIVFNQFGVALNPLFWIPEKTGIEFKIMNVNGLWGAAMSINSNNWGIGSPLMVRDCKYSTIEECIEVEWNYVFKVIDQHNSNKGSVNYDTKWEGTAKKWYKEWHKTSDKLLFFKQQKVGTYNVF